MDHVSNQINKKTSLKGVCKIRSRKMTKIDKENIDKSQWLLCRRSGFFLVSEDSWAHPAPKGYVTFVCWGTMRFGIELFEYLTIQKKKFHRSVLLN